MIIATAGHVDHGKTSLLQAITGVNADRLPEEKQRGMTIDLGYAYWPQEDGRVIGFIDVPGHEKFLANMLAGVGGIDHALLVVACDDGIMAQTREHLMLLQLTSHPEITVVLTKADRVDDERIKAIENDVYELLNNHNANIFVTSTLTGQGIHELQHHIQQLTTSNSLNKQRFRLAIDRAFNVKGTGLVVTGTALSGEVSVGDNLWLTGAEKSVRIRSLHAQNQATDHAYAGQRIALNITSNIEKSDISRGDWLLSEQPPFAAERVIVELTTLAPLKQWQPVHIHHAASHITGRVSLLGNTLAELILDKPLWLADNDKIVLRDISARATIAGARVLLLQSPKRGKRQPAFLSWLEQLRQASSEEETLSIHLARGSVALDSFGWARQLTVDRLQQLTQYCGYLTAGNALLNQDITEQWRQKILTALEQYHQQHDDQPGPGRDRLRRIALPTENPDLVHALIEKIQESGDIINHDGWLYLPNQEHGFSSQQQMVWEQVESLLQDNAWWVRDLAKEVGQDEQVIRQLLRFASRQGLVTAILKDRYYRNERIWQFADLVRELTQTQEAAYAADFRDRLGIGRKLAIQILEYFDRIGFTRRQGNAHRLRDSALFCTDKPEKL